MKIVRENKILENGDLWRETNFKTYKKKKKEKLESEVTAGLQKPQEHGSAAPRKKSKWQKKFRPGKKILKK